MIRFKSPKKAKLHSHLVPLIDIIFVTLIFFLVLYRFSTFDLSEGSEDADHITAGNLSGTYKMENTVFIQIDVDGNLFVNDVQIEDTIDSIDKVIDNPSTKSCIIIIDDNLSYETYGNLKKNLETLGIKRITYIK
jgi:biopolymer transport protein ExbD